jgi:hypothetical protein
MSEGCIVCKHTLFNELPAFTSELVKDKKHFILAPLWSVFGFRLCPRYFSGWSMGGVELISTPSIRHLEKLIFEKVESPGLTKVGVGTYRRVDW